MSSFVAPSLALPSLALVVLGLAMCARPPAAPAPGRGCPAHDVALDGACMSEEEAGAYCGKASTPVPGGCAFKSCPDGAPVDLGSGECISANAHPKVVDTASGDAGASHRCKGDAWLAVEGQNATCLPPGVRCGRGSRWAGGQCRPDTVCPRGAIADGETCVPVSHREHGEDLVDVGAWLRLVIGPDGGDGSSALCGPIAQRPWLAGVTTHGHAVVDVEAALIFPDNDVSRAEVKATARRRFDPRSVGAATTLAMTEHTEPLWKALRAIGGTANAASASIAVHCDVFGGDGMGGSHEDASAPKDGRKPPS